MFRDTILKIKVGKEDIFVKGKWFHSHFDLAVTDGLNAWLCHGGEDEVKERAEQWDQKPEEYIKLAEKRLGFLHPDSTYSFTDAGSDCRRLSLSFEKKGTSLEWRWKCQLSSDSRKITSEILDFLIQANSLLREDLANTSRTFDLMKDEADKCLAQSEKLCREKKEFEDAIYDKFLAVLNSKKGKIRKLREKIPKAAISDEKEESTDKTETCDENSDEWD